MASSAMSVSQPVGQSTREPAGQSNGSVREHAGQSDSRSVGPPVFEIYDGPEAPNEGACLS